MGCVDASDEGESVAGRPGREGGRSLMQGREQRGSPWGAVVASRAIAHEEPKAAMRLPGNAGPAACRTVCPVACPRPCHQAHIVWLRWTQGQQGFPEGDGRGSGGQGP